MKRAILPCTIALSLFAASLLAAGEGPKKLVPKPSAAPSTEAALSSAMIDAGIEAVAKELGVKNRPASSDAEFLRRVSLDLIGNTPSPDQILSFLANRDPNKREKLVDKMIGSPAYVEHWSDFWLQVLYSTNQERQRFRGDLQRWVKGQIAKNTRYDLFVRRLIRAQGFASRNGAVGFFLDQNNDPLKLTATTTRLFMGVQIECAQCHDHPFADWKQYQFLEMSAWFSRIEKRRKLKSEAVIAAELARIKNPKRRKRYMENARRFASLEGVFERPSGEFVVNERGEPVNRKNQAISKERRVVKPAFLFEQKIAGKEPSNRRESYALRVTAADNDFFTQMGVNRIWNQFFGRGLVSPLDDLSEVSFWSHPKLTKALGRAFAADGFDMRRLVRAIVLSKSYQRSSMPPPPSATPAKADAGGVQDLLMTYYGRMPVRPLGARPLANALAAALLPEGSRRHNQLAQRLRQTLKSLVGQRSLDLDRYEETIKEALFMQNSPLLRPQPMATGGTFVMQVMARQPNARERVTRIFLTALNRPPSVVELKRYLGYIETQKGGREAYDDLVWVLLNSSEFRTNR